MLNLWDLDPNLDNKIQKKALKTCSAGHFGLTYGLTRYDPGGLNMVRQVYHPMRNWRIVALEYTSPTTLVFRGFLLSTKII